MDERFGLCNSTSDGAMKLLCGVVAVKDRTLSDLPTLCKLNNVVQSKINDVMYNYDIVDYNRHKEKLLWSMAGGVN